MGGIMDTNFSLLNALHFYVPAHSSLITSSPFTLFVSILNAFLHDVSAYSSLKWVTGNFFQLPSRVKKSPWSLFCVVQSTSSVLPVFPSGCLLQLLISRIFTYPPPICDVSLFCLSIPPVLSSFLFHTLCCLSLSLSPVWNSERIVELQHKSHKHDVINTPHAMLICKCWECKKMQGFLFFLLSHSLFIPGVSLSPSPLLIPSHLPIPYCLSSFPPNSNPAFFAVLPPCLTLTSSKMIEVERPKQVLWRAVFALYLHTEMQKWIKMIHGKYPFVKAI